MLVCYSDFHVLRFYRATHMHGAVYAAVRCLSVCLSVTLVCCVEATELITKQLAYGL